MKKIFKSKKINKYNKIKILLLLLISFFISFYLNKLNIFKTNNFINILKNTSTNKITINNIKLNSNYLLNIGLTNFNKIKFDKQVFKQSKEKEINYNHQIYVYNTHQTEEYSTINNYNLTPTVLTASYILKDMLKEYNINVVVEDRDLKTDLKKYDSDYRNAYKVSRDWLESQNNNKYDLYIDLHRDSINYNLSNIVVDNKDYAKIMFVIGTNHNYEKNMELSKELNNEIEKINKSISRGIFTRHSIYNQDYNENCVLIELGGPESTYESISNSLSVLSLAINNYLGD